MENLENRQPERRNRLVRSLLAWWERNGYYVLVAFAGAEAFAPGRQTEVPIIPDPPTEPPVRREDFNHLNGWAGAARRGVEDFCAEEAAGLLPAGGVPDDLASLALPGVDVDGEVAGMRNWLDTVDPRDFGTPPTATTGV